MQRWLVASCLSIVACGRAPDPPPAEPRARDAVGRPVRISPSAPTSPPARGFDPMERAGERDRMVRTQLETRGIHDARVLAAMRRVPRHLFVPEDVRASAYDDTPLPIGFDQTISQPYIVGVMTQLAAVQPGARVLEVGTGSGYQAAVLAELGATVYTIEIVAPLARRAAATLARLGYDRVHVKAGDGYRGWPAHAPFDAIVVTAAPRTMPEPLEQQVRVGGTIVAPIGEGLQELVVWTREEHGFRREMAEPVRFVPMTGEAERAP